MEAAANITRYIKGVTLQESLRQHLTEQAVKFSVEKFSAGLREVIFELMDRTLLPRRAGMIT